MKHFYISIREVFSLVFILLTGIVSFAQVGIGTETPNEHAILDVFSNSSSPGGLLMPRVALQNTSGASPLGEHVAGMTVYNTASTGDVTPGFYFNDGTQWVRIAADSGPQPEGWLLQGNSGTNPNNHFLGTTDNQPLRIRTNNANRFEFTTGGHLRANGFGTAGAPTYSWVGRTNTGLWSPANNTMGFSTNGSERMRVNATGQLLVNTTTTALAGAAFESQMGGSFTTAILGVGSGGATAIRAENQGPNGDALWARNSAANGSGNAFGIWATSNQIEGSAIVSGLRSNGYFANAGISAISQVTGSSTTSYGIIAETYSTNAQSTPVKGQTSRSPTGGIFLNAWENNDAVGGTGQYIGGGSVDAVGLVGISNASGWLLDYGYGVIGEGEYYGVFANGEIGGSGTKTFLIDHPLDPENKLLRHYSMESSEVLNLYRGSATFDNKGRATVEMPEYFEAININYTYQLTAIGAAMPNLYIAQEIKNNKFEIAGGVPGKKVNWVVYGERNDPYLQKYPEKRKVVLNKKEHERGKYYRPELFDQPEEMGVFNKYKRSMTEMKIKKKNEGNLNLDSFSNNHSTQQDTFEQNRINSMEKEKTEKHFQRRD